MTSENTSVEAAAAAEAANKEADWFYAQLDGFTYHAGAKATDIYTEWSDKYENVLLNMPKGFNHPKKSAKIVSAYLPDKSCRILDFASGTGLVGQELSVLGYTNLDAIDGSRGMLDVAAKKGIFKHLFEEIIGGDAIKSVEKGSYDAVVCSGSYAPGQLGPSELRLQADIVKPGGICYMALWKGYLEHEYLRDMEPAMDKLEAAGVWSKLESGTIENYFRDDPGSYYVYRKL